MSPCKGSAAGPEKGLREREPPSLPLSPGLCPGEVRVWGNGVEPVTEAGRLGAGV